MNRILTCLALVLLAAKPVSAQGIVNPVVSGNELRATISLPLGLGADLAVTFEQVVGLTPANLGLSAEVVNPLDPTLLSRLFSGVSIPAAFPVLLRIEPPASGGLSFSGVVSIEIHTHNLHFTAGTPLRLFLAPAGGKFADVTETMGMGSYRVRGSSGGFSELLIVADLRPVDRVIGRKLDKLDSLLTEYGSLIAGPVLAELTALAADARAAWSSGATLTAIQKVEAFAATVRQHSGADIPDVWRSARDLTNAAGYLRAAAGTLRFSLSVKSNGGL